MSVEFLYLQIKIPHGQSGISKSPPGEGHMVCGSQHEESYFHNDIHLAHRRFFRFLVGQEHYKFRLLLFRLALEPRVLTKVISVVAVQMRQSSYTSFPYLDH